MEITNKIKAKIEEMYRDSNYNVKSVSLGYKKVDGQRTDEIAIVVRVERKKKLSELSADEIIPSTIMIDGQEIRTDVIEDANKVVAMACFASTDADVLKLQGDPALITPLRGGQEITQFPTGWTDLGGGSYGFTVGTLGFIGVDDIDGKVVGVTNNHVVIGKGDINADRDIPTESASPYNIIEPIEWVVDTSSYAPGALLRDESDPQTFVTGAPNIKRYIPFDVNGTNYVDVALIIMDPTKIDNTSYQIHQPNGEPDYLDYLPFATTAEIDSLLVTPRTIYSTGRTTGPKGWGVSTSCTLEITALSETINVGGLSDSDILFSDVVRFEFSDGSNYPIDQGDSGSAVVADFDGTRKIIGLAFAGNLTAGFFCRIDRIADAIKLREWNSHYTYDATVPTATITMAPIEDSSSNDVTVTPECKYLFQAGTTLTDTYTDLLSITPLACSVTPTITPTVTPTITPTPSLGGGSTLTNDLIAWWSMDEGANVTRADSHTNGYDLSDTLSGVGSAAAKVGNGAVTISGTGQVLEPSAGGSTALSPVGHVDFTISGWVNFTNTTADAGKYIMSNFDFSNGYYLGILFGGDNNLTWQVGGSSFVTAAITTGTWYHFVCYHDATADEIGIIINDGTPTTTAHTAGFTASSNTVKILNGFSGLYSIGGTVDELAAWNRLLTPAEITELYNSGSGIGYP